MQTMFKNNKGRGKAPFNTEKHKFGEMQNFVLESQLNIKKNRVIKCDSINVSHLTTYVVLYFWNANNAAMKLISK